MSILFLNFLEKIISTKSSVRLPALPAAHSAETPRMSPQNKPDKSQKTEGCSAGKTLPAWWGRQWLLQTAC